MCELIDVQSLPNTSLIISLSPARYDGELPSDQKGHHHPQCALNHIYLRTKNMFASRSSRSAIHGKLKKIRYKKEESRGDACAGKCVCGGSHITSLSFGSSGCVESEPHPAVMAFTRPRITLGS